MSHDTPTMLPANVCHNISQPPTALARAARGGPAYLTGLRQSADAHSLAAFAARYLEEEVRGVQSLNTLEAKARDLAGFVAWFVGFNGHGRIETWLPRDTQAYLNHLEHTGKRAATTVNRVFASLRRFARWAHEQPGHVFECGGLPTRNIRALDVDEPECKKLTRGEIHQLFKAADTLVLTEKRRNAMPRRNRAVLAVLRYTGLRVSELVALRRDQYQGNHLVNVARKGRSRSKGLYMTAECRRHLDDYLNIEWRPGDAGRNGSPLFCSSKPGRFMTRQLVFHLLRHIAQEASKHQKTPIALHPHRLRHSFGAEFRAKTGSDTETAAALGHTGLQYVGRYVRRSSAEREAALEEMFTG